MVCIVTVVVHVLYCDSGTCMFCIVTVVREKKKFEKYLSLNSVDTHRQNEHELSAQVLR